MANSCQVSGHLSRIILHKVLQCLPQSNQIQVIAHVIIVDFIGKEHVRVDMM